MQYKTKSLGKQIIDTFHVLSRICGCNGCQLRLKFVHICRYKAIVWPLKVRTSKAVVGVTIFMIWIGSIIFALPALLLSKTYDYFLPVF